MDFKKKWQRFWTLQRHNDGGFTLVELVVVIAIMAILAGVGTTGYAGYIKSANKNSDRVLVGNIIRAIETGGNSAAFVSNDSRVIGSISYPVGFVALSTEGAQVLTSTASNNAVEGSCVFETKEITIASATVKNKTCSDCNTSIAGTCYETSTETITFCTTHSSATPTNCETDFTISHSSGGCGGDSHSTSGTNIVSAYADSGRLYRNSGNGTCQFAANPGLAAGEIGQHENNALYKAVIAAFGSVDNLKLKYDGWTSEEGVDFATFATGADGVMSDLESLSGMLAMISTIPVVGDYVDGDYANSEEVLVAVTNSVLSAHTTADSWKTVWDNAANATWDSYGFGIKGRENYSAARVAYNTSFATYLEANGVDSKYADVISGFNAQELLGYGLPGLVCTDAFTDTESPLKDKFTAAGDDDGTVFKQCAEMFEEYKNSTACQENAEIFYNTMSTFEETMNIASDPNNGYDSMFDYYNSYVDELSGLYQAAQDASGDGIMIIVSVANGKMQFSVSPSAANPRNSK